MRTCGHLLVQRIYAAKTVIFSQGEPARHMYLVMSGKVRISRTTVDGNRITLAILGGGDIIGEEVVLAKSGEHANEATFIDEGVLSVLRTQDLFSIFSQYPIVAINIARYLSEQREAANAAVEDLAYLKVADRITRLFGRLSKHFGVAETRGARIDVRLTHADIASLVGSTRETVSVVLRDLITQGKIEMHKGQYLLPASKQVA
jgi:CRP/FNR family cyclic AMP-dependent transcriptional regulator